MWYSAISNALDTLLTHIASVLPSMIAALLILFAGYLLSKLAKAGTFRLLQKAGIERLSETTGIQSQLKRFGEKATLSSLISTLIFWIIFLLFLVTAAETLGFPQLTNTIDSFVLFLPKLIVASLILLFGLAASNIARAYVFKSATQAGYDFAKPLANIIYALLILLIASISIGQLDIETRLLDILIAVAFSAMGLGSALSMGIGSRNVSENIMYSIYVSDLIQEGDSVILKDGIKGTIETIGSIATTINDQDNRKIIIKNKDLIDNLIILPKE